MLAHIAMALLVRFMIESFAMRSIMNDMHSNLKDYHSDLEHLVHILNKNNIELEEFDYIVLNNIRRKVKLVDD